MCFLPFIHYWLDKFWSNISTSGHSLRVQIRCISRIKILDSHETVFSWKIDMFEANRNVLVPLQLILGTWNNNSSSVDDNNFFSVQLILRSAQQSVVESGLRADNESFQIFLLKKSFILYDSFTWTLARICCTEGKMYKATVFKNISSFSLSHIRFDKPLYNGPAHLAYLQLMAARRRWLKEKLVKFESLLIASIYLIIIF